MFCSLLLCGSRIVVAKKSSLRVPVPVSLFGDPRQAPQASKDPDKAMGFRQSPAKKPLQQQAAANRVLSWQWSSDSEVGFSATFHPTPSPFSKEVLPQQIVSPFSRGKGISESVDACTTETKINMLC